MTDEIEPQADAAGVEPKAEAETQMEPAAAPVAVEPAVPVESVAIAEKAPRRPFAGRAAISAVPVICMVGLIVAGLLTAGVYARWTPTLPGSGDTSTPSPTLEPSGSASIAPSPTDQVVVNPEVAVKGTIVYARNGSLWVQSGATARQITVPKSGSMASQPTWSPDGQWIYYIDTRNTPGNWYSPDNYNAIVGYDLHYPVLCRIHPDGSGGQDILSSIIARRKLKTNYWLRQPEVAPNGAVAAIVSDGPTDPGVQDPMIHLVNLRTNKLASALPMRENSSLGLSDPAFSPDGSVLAYVMEARSGKFGAPSIWLYNFSKKTSRLLASRFRSPSWSPDGKYIAATRVSGDALNVVVLDASSGKQVGAITSDGVSWGPVWSPAGDQLIYMHMIDANVNLNMVHISGSAASPTFSIEPNLTDYSGLDGGSPPAWYIPGYGPAPTPTPAASDTSSPGASASSANLPTSGPSASPS
jgi:Tol biopolymer transport system component